MDMTLFAKYIICADFHQSAGMHKLISVCTYEKNVPLDMYT